MIDELQTGISYYINEIDNISDPDKIVNFDDLLKEIENSEIYDDFTISKLINYKENYTVKELLIICEYYGYSKELKNKKCNKDEIIHFLIDFESNPANSDIVLKRKNMWFFMNELKNDKFMKKYVLWS